MNRLEELKIVNQSMEWAIKELKADFAKLEYIAKNADYGDFDVSMACNSLESTCETFMKRLRSFKEKLEKESAYDDFNSVID